MSRIGVISTAAAFVAIASTMLGAGPARAAALLVHGAGNDSCGDWLQHPQEADGSHVVMASWIDGYLSAINEWRADSGLPAFLGQSTNNNGRDAWISQYCQAHPLDNLFKAALALVAELAKTGR